MRGMTYSVVSLVLLERTTAVVCLAWSSYSTPLFHHSSSWIAARCRTSRCTLSMGGGLKRNKQLALARKYAQKKEEERLRRMQEEQSSADESSAVSSEKILEKGLTDDELQERKDRQTFEDLLNNDSATIDLSAELGGAYLTEQQEMEAIEARMEPEGPTIPRLFEGDQAPAAPFEDLVSIKTGNAIGPVGAERLIPWLNKSKAKRNDYLVVVTDPRIRSGELRSFMKELAGNLPKDILDRLIVVNADSPKENRRWMKKNSITQYDVFSDEKREWMGQYTAMGDEEWSMSMFVLSRERVKKVIRGLDEYVGCEAIKAALSMYR